MSLFPTCQKLTPNATLLYDCFPGLLTREAPSKWYTPIPPSTSCWQKFSGTDPITGFAPPTGAPFFAQDTGSTVAGYGMYVIDHTHPFPTQDQAGFDSVIGIGTENMSYRGVSMTALTTNHYNHVNGGFVNGVQSHFHIYRNVLAPGFADLSEICFDVVIALPDHAPLLDSTYKFRTLHDYKTKDDDYRPVIFIVRADAALAAEYKCDVGTIGWCLTIDNVNNGLPTMVEYVRMYNFDVPVPVDEYFNSRVYWQRSTSYADLETHEFKHIVTSSDRGEEVVFDVNAASIAQYNIDHPLACTNNYGWVKTNCINRGMGINSKPYNRLYLVSNYFGGKAGSDVKFKLARFTAWDGLP